MTLCRKLYCPDNWRRSSANSSHGFRGWRLTAGRRPKGKGRGSMFAYVGPTFAYVGLCYHYFGSRFACASPVLVLCYLMLAFVGPISALCLTYLAPSPYVGPGRPYVGPMFAYVSRMLRQVSRKLALCRPKLALSCPYVGPILALCCPIMLKNFAELC